MNKHALYIISCMTFSLYTMDNDPLESLIQQMETQTISENRIKLDPAIQKEIKVPCAKTNPDEELNITTIILEAKQTLKQLQHRRKLLTVHISNYKHELYLLEKDKYKLRSFIYNLLRDQLNQHITEIENTILMVNKQTSNIKKIKQALITQQLKKSTVKPKVRKNTNKKKK